MKNTYKNLKGLVAILALSFIGISMSSAQVDVTFRVDMSDADASNGVYITGQLNEWEFTELTKEGDTDIYSVTLSLESGEYYIYYFLNTADWESESRETVPEACANSSEHPDDPWDGDRMIQVPAEDVTIGVAYGTCDEIGEATSVNNVNIDTSAKIYPNPASETVYITFAEAESASVINLYSMNGQLVQTAKKSAGNDKVSINTNQLAKGLYLVEISTEKSSSVHKISVK